MKKLLLFTLGALTTLSLSAKVWTVDNNNGASADFSLLQTAIDNALSGDTLYIMGSPNYYDGNALIRLNKTLTLIGPGFFLGENQKTQTSNEDAKIYSMVIGEGANNSKITGLNFHHSAKDLLISKDTPLGAEGTSGVNNVIISRNKILRVLLKYTTGTLIEQNYISTPDQGIYINHECSSTLIQNNIIKGGGSATAVIYGDFNVTKQEGYELSNTIVRNNTLDHGFQYISGIEISNNIISGGNLWYSCNNVLKNNLFGTTQTNLNAFSTGNSSIGNVFSVIANTLFVEAIPAIDNDYILKADSPAKGFGIDGTDAGAFGGPNPYILSGLPPIPSIYELNTSGVGTIENGLKVTIKAKTNQ
jgi:hypothetical protein